MSENRDSLLAMIERVRKRVERAFMRLIVRSVDEPEPLYRLPDETDEQFKERVRRSLEKDR